MPPSALLLDSQAPCVRFDLDWETLELLRELRVSLKVRALTPEDIDNAGRMIWWHVRDSHGCLRSDLGERMLEPQLRELWNIYYPGCDFESPHESLPVPARGLLLELPTMKISIFAIGGPHSHSRRRARIATLGAGWDLAFERAGAHGSTWEITRMKRQGR